jgi:cholesterol oxidase
MREAHEHFDAIVIGSGFGGAVMAYRLAEAGRRVCVLERGKAYPPGSFPRSPIGFRRNFWDPSQGQHGLFHIWSFRQLEAVVSSGLGGGSLIYANVLIRKDPEWFEQRGWRDGVYERWPVSYPELERHYDAVEKMLRATPYPLDRAPYSSTAKTLAFRDAAKKLGYAWTLPNLAVTFGNDPTRPRPGEPIQEPNGNLHGTDNRSTCRLCGECDVGCNFGSKNTLDFNYLSEAKRLGAEIRTRCEARHFRFRGAGDGGYVVEYVIHDPACEGAPTDTRKLELHAVTARCLVLAAGTLGSTYLLLTNAGGLGGVSKALGTRFSGNGDFLAAVYRCVTESPDGRTIPRVLDASHAPVITSTIRMPDERDRPGARGFYLQDAGYPEWVNWVIEAMNARGNLERLGRFVGRRVRSALTRDPDSDIGAELANLLGDAWTSGASMPLLGMGRDSPDGAMRLRRGRGGRRFLEVDWRDAGSREYFARLRRTAREVSAAMGGRYLESPLAQFFNRFVTVHPVGGCPMGRDIREGVVDSRGEVFNAPGLFVADGAVMPGPVGPNPSLTIAALADRFAEIAIERTRRGGTGKPVVVIPPRPPRVALEFTEDMKGFFQEGAETPDSGARQGEAEGTRLAFRLTIVAEDVDELVESPAHEARARGWVDCAPLGGRREVTEGRFHLFTTPGDSGRPRREMRYVLPFVSAAGEPYLLEGMKHVRDEPGLDIWPDLTTLFVHLYRMHGAEKRAYGAGVLHILVPDFARQLTTIRLHGAGAAEYASKLARFGQFFFGSVWDVYAPSALTRGGPSADRQLIARKPSASDFAIGSMTTASDQ